MSDWFTHLQQIKRDFVRAAREGNDWDGIRESIVNKYPDDIHFVYELLQNADDQEAHEVRFIVHRDHLVFEHDGKPFEQKHVEGITRIGTSDKREQSNKIGSYGIGFKSVYSVTDCPQIYTHLDGQPFAFEIADLVVPEQLPIDERHPPQGTTRFVLPYKEARATSVYSQLADKMRESGANTIMFLNHLRQMSWQMDEEIGVHVCKRPEASEGICRLSRHISSQGVTTDDTEACYQCYSKQVSIAADKNNLKVSIAFRLNDNHQIVEEKGENYLNVYFPTRQTTRLKFRLHAPMLLTPERANIRDKAPENQLLVRACATLLVETLPKLRDAGLLTVDCLNCLPIRHQDFPPRREVNGIVYEQGFFFRPMYEQVRAALSGDEPLLPTDRGDYVAAKQLRIPESPVRALVSREQITSLFVANKSSPICWTPERIKTGANSPTSDLYAFLQDIGIKLIDLEDFARGIKSNPLFLEEQSDEWLIEFYTTLLQRKFLWEKGKTDAVLRRANIIRLEDNHHIAPFSEVDKPLAYLPLATGSIQGFATIKRNIAQDENATEFFRALGLSEPDKVDVVLQHILPKYKGRGSSGFNLEQYCQDVELIGKAVDEASKATYSSTKRSELLREIRSTKFILASNAATEKLALVEAKIALQRTEKLLVWFAGNPDAWFVSEKLHQYLAWPSIKEFVNYQQTPVLEDTIRVHAIKPDKGYVTISTKQRGIAGFDPDADIVGLQYAIQNINPHRAHLLWNLLLSHIHLLTGEVETSHDNKYGSSSRDRHFSKIYDACNDAAWLPDQQGTFCKPRTLTIADLPHDFDKSPQAKLLADTLGMKRTGLSQEEDLAKKLGVSLADVELIKKHKESFEQWKSSRSSLIFDEDDESYSSLRADKTREQQAGMSAVTYEKKLRSVRTSSPDLRDADRQYLVNFYENAARELLCQICQTVAFRLHTNEHFFVAVHCVNEKQIVSKLKEPQELLKNKLALCPTCAAKYLYANGYKNCWHELQQQILYAESTMIPIRLAGASCQIRFKPKHLGDLKVVLRQVMQG